jgi:hypothetical protein
LELCFDFGKNKTIYLTVTLVLIILIIYARRKDKKDFEKLGVTPLSDNHKSGHYYYQIIVSTVQRKDSGTKSKVKIFFQKNSKISLNRFILFYRVIIMEQIFVHLMILIEKFFNVVELMKF